jgi:hypothetical protein
MSEDHYKKFKSLGLDYLNKLNIPDLKSLIKVAQSQNDQEALQIIRELVSPKKIDKELTKQIQEALQNIENRFKASQKIQTALIKSIRTFQNEWGFFPDHKEIEVYVENLFSTVDHIFNKEGLYKPTAAKECINWYLGEKYKNVELTNVPKFERMHFFEWERWEKLKSIINLTYDDWFECRRRAPIDGWQAGENQFTENGINRVGDLPFDQYKLISEAQEKTYNEEVNRIFIREKDTFQNNLESSDDKEHLLNIEIETIEKVLKPDPKKQYENAIAFKFNRFIYFREKYKNMVAAGNRDYHKIKSPKCFEYSMEIEIDAYAKYLNWLKNIKLGKEVDVLPQQTTIKQDGTENDFTTSTIDDWLFEFKEKMSESDYNILVSALVQYFDTGSFPTLKKTIRINGRPNKKLFGWAMNRIFEANSKGVEKDLLLFAKHNISLFTDVQFDENNVLKSNLYKYFTTKTK